MSMDNQVMLLRQYYLTEIDRIYEHRFQMRLMAVLLFDQNRFTNKLNSIETISSIIERACVDCNPKRMMKYIIVLKEVIDDLVEKTDKDYKKMWDDKLTH